MSAPAPLDQLNEPTKDHLPDENARNNCEFTSSAWIVRDLGSEPDCDGDELHDEAMGQNRTGEYDMTNDGGRMFAAMARRGVALSVYRASDPAAIVARLHQHVAAGGDALINIPSQWGTPVAQQAPGFTTHMVAVAYTLAGPPAGLRCMNPWPGFWHDGSDAYWAARICYGYAILATKAPPTTGGATMGTPTGWKDDGTTLTAPNGIAVTLGFRDYVLTHSWDPNNWPLEAATGLPSVELGNPTIGAGSRQTFRQGALGYTTARNVYPMWTGQELLAWIGKAGAQDKQIASLNAQIAALQAQIQQLQQQPPVSNPAEHAKAQALDALMACYNVHA